MIHTLAAKARRLFGRQTELDLAFEAWAQLRGGLRRQYGMKRATEPGGWLDYFGVLSAASGRIPADPPTRVRIIALEVFENTLYHGGRPHIDCDCESYRERAAERNAEVLAGRKPRPVKFVPGQP